MEIYENTVGVHTFELNLRLSGFDEYRERAVQLYDEASDILNESGKGVWQQRNGTICDYRTYGIRLQLEKADFVWLKLVVSPRNLLGNQNPFGITKITAEMAEQLVESIQTFLETRGFPYRVGQFQLSRIDLCTNIVFEDESMPTTIIRLLNRTPPKGEYHRVSFSSAESESGMEAYEKNRRSYMLALQQECIKVYDKVYEIQKNSRSPDCQMNGGLLRIEVTLKREAITKWLVKNAVGNVDVIGVTKLFSDAAPQLICEKLRKALPYGIYLKKSEIKRRIQNSRFSDRICADMWEVAKMYHLCKDPQSARDRILKFVVGGDRHPKRQYRELLERFEQVEIQPVPLSKKDPEIVYAPLVYLEFMLGMRQKTGVIEVKV